MSLLFCHFSLENSKNTAERRPILQFGIDNEAERLQKNTARADNFGTGGRVWICAANAY
jgi:hypothetical protein